MSPKLFRDNGRGRARAGAGGHLASAAASGQSFSVCQRLASLWASSAQVVAATGSRGKWAEGKSATTSLMQPLALPPSESDRCDESLRLAKWTAAECCGQLTFEDQIGSSSGQSQQQQQQPSCCNTKTIVCDSAAEEAEASVRMRFVCSTNSTSVVSNVATANNSNYGNNGQVPTTQQPKYNDTTTTATSSMRLLPLKLLQVNASDSAAQFNEASPATVCRRTNANQLIDRSQCSDQATSLQAPQWKPFELANEHAKLSSQVGVMLLEVLLIAMILMLASSTTPNRPMPLAAAQTLQTDPRPTIYSGQISFGLLLSAHSSPGADLSTAASSSSSSFAMRFEGHPADIRETETSLTNWTATTTSGQQQTAADGHLLNATSSNQTTILMLNQTNITASGTQLANQFEPLNLFDLLAESSSGLVNGRAIEPERGHFLEKRQIFERPSPHQVRRQQQQQHALEAQKQAEAAAAAAAAKQQQQANSLDSACSQVNPSALYAGMGAIWASHQANLVGDSQLAIGTYVYDSCNDLDIGQRQSVRIVSNLNAFQQTTCEAPRGSPISLTIAHGENQLRAIQLLTSFRVPVITTREPMALEDYHLLTKDQRRFLFSTAPSSRHLAVGALKFTKRVVARSAASPKLPNQHYKMSSKNGLIVISRNLPAKFIAYLIETIPNHVNYEILQTSQPIEQVRSVEALESILMLNSQTKGASDDSSSGSADSLSSAGTSSAATNKLESRVWPPPPPVGALMQRERHRRNSDDQDSGSSSDSSDSDSGNSEQQQQHRMLSPTILMFITPAEAIDLVTRLRNDLAEVSRYYSLVVSTREDISPALRTIFHRRGSGLCSGKAFYTISPKPDEVSEFGRYFRDTVAMEGESSDHPLICEFSKYKTSSKTDNDLDDISTEAVIKAVWAAAAAFKLVHKRECSTYLTSSNSASSTTNANQGGNLYTANNDHLQGGEATSTRSLKQGRRQSQTSPGKGSSTPHADCLVKMNKNMSNLVQRALRKLDVHINSTGLQSLDGFRIKFDESNELLTNKFSIKYINRECEITELGEYSGTQDSQLYFYQESALLKSLESTLPDSWPIPQAPTPAPAAASKSKPTTTTPGGGTRGGSGTGQLDETGGDSAGASQADGGTAAGSSDEPNSSSSSSHSKGGGGGDEDQDSGAQLDNEKQPSTLIENEAPKKRRSNGKWAQRKIQQESNRNQNILANVRQQQQQPVVFTGGTRGGFKLTEGLTDFVTEAAATPTTKTKKTTTNGPTLPTSTKSTRSDMATVSIGAEVEQQKTMRKLKPFPPGKGVTVKEWLPKEHLTNKMNPTQRRTSLTGGAEVQTASDEPTQAAATTTSTTRAPTTTTTTALAPSSSLPESEGNTDLDMPPFKATTTTRLPTRTGSHLKMARSSQDMAAAASSTTTELTGTGDYVTMPSIVRTQTSSQPAHGHSDSMATRPLASSADVERPNESYRSYATNGDTQTLAISRREPRLGFLRDLINSPNPLPAGATNSPMGDMEMSSAKLAANRNELRHNMSSGASSSSRSRLRSHFKWIYGSWFTLTILGANICGALLTLYVLTFLLVKNCDGSLDRENQGIRSMHLLSVIVVFFGSTLFIVYPTPSLCILRSSWHNFALVLMFGSLLLQTMQTRSISSIGLGGRPNRLNQLLTLLFMVGVQVSFELQRWKYESANYVNFVNQYFGSQENGDKKLLIFSNSIASQFNPLNSFNDQVTPVSIQVSEKYQSLLHDYCSQPVEDFLQGQFYLWIIMSLLVVFSITIRRTNQCNTNQSHHQSKSSVGLLAQARGKRTIKGGKFNANKSKLAPTNYTLTSGKLLASQHETNELIGGGLAHLSPANSDNTNAAACQTFGGSGPFSINSKAAHRRHSQTGDVFLVTLISVPIYFISIILQVHGQNLLVDDHHDLVASVTMVLVAFIVLIGIFLPVLKNYHRFGELVSGPSSPDSSSSPALVGDHNQLHHHPILGATTLARARKRAAAANTTTMPQRNSAQNSASPSSSAFAMFPEFASTGLRRPSSIGGDSLGRRPFAETKESRRNMGLSLANLPPEPESLRGLCVHNHRSSIQPNNHLRPTAGTCQGEQHTLAANMKLNLAGVDEEPQMQEQQANHHHHHNHHHHQQQQQTNDQPAHRNHNKHHHNNNNNQHHHHHRKSQPSASSRRSSISSTGEKRLIMLDVDPCCPRHGVNTGSSPVD